MQREIIPNSEQERSILQKIQGLSPDKLSQVEDFVDFLSQRDEDRKLVQAGSKLAEEVFNKVWDNDEDKEYDQL